jgi:hypothetical protein
MHGRNNGALMPLTSALPMVGLFAIGVFVFVGLYWLLTHLVAPMRRLREALLPTVLGAAAFSLLLLLFGAIANSFLVDAAESRDTYLAAARAGLWATYVLAAVASVAFGAALARRGDRAKAATLTLLGVLTFMVVVLPFSELVAECYANVTVILRPSC